MYTKRSLSWRPMRKIKSIVLTALLLPTLFIVITPPATADPVWFNAGWTYRKEITISDNVADLQSQINISYNGGGDVSCEGNARTDFEDIRFACANGTEVPYWIEETINSDRCIVWVKNEYNDSSLYLYYGNAGASTTSNMTTTWEYSHLWTSDHSSGFTEEHWAGDRVRTYKDSMPSTDTVRVLTKYNVFSLYANNYAGKVGIGVADDIDGGTWANSVNIWLSADINSQGASDSEYGAYIRSEDGSNNGDADGSTDADVKITKDVGNYRKIMMTLNSSSAKAVFYSTYWETLLDEDEVTDTNVFPDVSLDEFYYFSHAQDVAGEHTTNYDGTNDEMEYGAYRFSTTNGEIEAAFKWMVIGVYTNGKEPTLSFEAEETPGNLLPTISSPSPGDGAAAVAVDGCSLCATINDSEGDSFDYYIFFDGVEVKNETGVNNGTYCVAVPVECGRQTYDWSVNVTNGTAWVNESYAFTTESCTVIYTNPTPSGDIVCPGFGGFAGLCVTGANAFAYNITFYQRVPDDQYRKEITINSSQVPSDLTNFPICINITDTDLRDNAQSDGDDILFTNETGTQLNHEIEVYNGTTGWLVAWVNVTDLSGSSDTIIYMYYGNDTASNQENVENVWDSNYITVQHFVGETYTDIDDSTATNNDVVNWGGDPEYNQLGYIGYAVGFDGSFDFLETAQTFTWGKVTLEALFRVDSFPGSGAETILENYDPSSGEHTGLRIYDDNKLNFYVDDDSNAYWGEKNPQAMSVSTKYYGAGTFDYTTNNLYIYLNNYPRYTKSGVLTGIMNADEPFYFGSKEGTEQYFDGLLDEIRISNIARSQNWIQTTYNSLFNATDGGFFTLGSEETLYISNPLATYNNVSGSQCTPLAVNYSTLYQWSFNMSEYGDPFNFVESPTYTFTTNTEEGCAAGDGGGGGGFVYLVIPIFFMIFGLIFMKTRKKEWR